MAREHATVRQHSQQYHSQRHQWQTCLEFDRCDSEPRRDSFGRGNSNSPGAGDYSRTSGISDSNCDLQLLKNSFDLEVGQSGREWQRIARVVTRPQVCSRPKILNDACENESAKTVTKDKRFGCEHVDGPSVGVRTQPIVLI